MSANGSPREWLRYTVLFLLVALLYVGGYFVLMVDVPSVDDQGRYTYDYSFRFAEVVRAEGPLSIFVHQETWLNWFFYPVHCAAHTLAPRSENSPSADAPAPRVP
jgi:hypothetical protein